MCMMQYLYLKKPICYKDIYRKTKFFLSINAFLTRTELFRRWHYDIVLSINV